MQAADSFNLVVQDNVNLDVYTLLPAFWQVMLPAEKTLAVKIVKKYGKNAWNVDCCRELSSRLKVKLAELPSLQPCIFLAMEYPSHLERGLVSDKDEVVGPSNDKDAATINRIESSRLKADHGLTMFQRIPEGLKGEELLDHQCAFRQREYARKPGEHKISPGLNCEPRNSHQMSLMEIGYAFQAQGNLMADVNAGVPVEKAAKCVLTIWVW